LLRRLQKDVRGGAALAFLPHPIWTLLTVTSRRRKPSTVMLVIGDCHIISPEIRTNEATRLSVQTMYVNTEKFKLYSWSPN